MDLDRATLRHAVAAFVPPDRVDSFVEVVLTTIRNGGDSIEEYDPDQAIFGSGKYVYRVSVLKLCGALALALRPLFGKPDESPYVVGLAIIAAIAGLDGAVERITADEAAVCQALHEEAANTGHKPQLQVSQLTDRVAKLTASSQGLDARMEIALDELQKKHVIECNLTAGTVLLKEFVLVGRRDL